MKLSRRQLRSIIAETVNQGRLSTSEELIKTVNWFRDVIIPAINEDPDDWTVTTDRDYYVWGNRDRPQIYIPKGSNWGPRANNNFGNTLKDSGKTEYSYTLGDAYWMLNDMNKLGLNLPLQSFESEKDLSGRSGSTNQLANELGIAHTGEEKIRRDFVRGTGEYNHRFDAPTGFDRGI